MNAQRMCPLCNENMRVRVSQGIEVDHCARCGGLWLDKGEFDPLVAHRFGKDASEAVLEHQSRPPRRCRRCGMLNHIGLVNCERCGAAIALNCPHDQSPMRIVEFSGLEFDHCPSCKGIWIDGDETKALARQERLKQAQQDSPAKVSRPSANSRVVCIGCGREVVLGLTIDDGGVRWCEHCVAAGKLRHSQPSIEPVAPPRAEPTTLPQEQVRCAGCGGMVDVINTVIAAEQRWCEQCFIHRRVPGADKEAESVLRYQAAQSFAAAKRRQDEDRYVVTTMAEARERRRTRLLGRRNRYLTPEEMHDAKVVVQHAFRKLRGLFSSKKPQD